ncbi:hypothetical protein VNO80_21837 [Phaseolus coccineus]|uniref:Uncharacterized protein n=1 Tax=Phaseolus coccineus TaxID=3886 RepID=A0AAN9M3S8_PHACN
MIPFRLQDKTVLQLKDVGVCLIKYIRNRKWWLPHVTNHNDIKRTWTYIKFLNSFDVTEAQIQRKLSIQQMSK